MSKIKANYLPATLDIGHVDRLHASVYGVPFVALLKAEAPVDFQRSGRGSIRKMLSVHWKDQEAEFSKVLLPKRLVSKASKKMWGCPVAGQKFFQVSLRYRVIVKEHYGLCAIWLKTHQVFLGIDGYRHFPVWQALPSLGISKIPNCR